MMPVVVVMVVAHRRLRGCLSRRLGGRLGRRRRAPRHRGPGRTRAAREPARGQGREAEAGAHCDDHEHLAPPAQAQESAIA
jgi:hypothetical protein